MQVTRWRTGHSGPRLRMCRPAGRRSVVRHFCAKVTVMQLLRTPDEAFAGITDFPYEPSYATLADGVRMAYVTAGPADGQPVVLMHGEPTWSYLWRSVIPVLADAGLRVVAPDLVGFGRSDKPAQADDHTYARHVEWMRALLFDQLDLRGVTVVGHDWGGLIGLRVATENAERVA